MFTRQLNLRSSQNICPRMCESVGTDLYHIFHVVIVWLRLIGTKRTVVEVGWAWCDARLLCRGVRRHPQSYKWWSAWGCSLLSAALLRKFWTNSRPCRFVRGLLFLPSLALSARRCALFRIPMNITIPERVRCFQHSFWISVFFSFGFFFFCLLRRTLTPVHLVACSV
jgi:hypothetical protein